MKTFHLSYVLLEASSGTLNVFFINFEVFVISFGRVVVPSPKIVINLPGTYEKLPCKGEPDRFSS